MDAYFIKSSTFVQNFKVFFRELFERHCQEVTTRTYFVLELNGFNKQVRNAKVTENWMKFLECYPVSLLVSLKIQRFELKS